MFPCKNISVSWIFTISKNVFCIAKPFSTQKVSVSKNVFASISFSVSKNKFSIEKCFRIKIIFSIENNFLCQKNVVPIYRAINAATKEHRATEDCRMLTRAVKIRDVSRILGTFRNENRGRAAGTRRGVGHTFLRAAQISRFFAINHWQLKSYVKINPERTRRSLCKLPILTRGKFPIKCRAFWSRGRPGIKRPVRRRPSKKRDTLSGKSVLNGLFPFQPQIPFQPLRRRLTLLRRKRPFFRAPAESERMQWTVGQWTPPDLARRVSATIEALRPDRPERCRRFLGITGHGQSPFRPHCWIALATHALPGNTVWDTHWERP